MSTAAKETAPTLGKLLAAELQQEAVATRKILSRLPDDKLTWQPHPKSMTLVRLAAHIVEMTGWTPGIISEDVLDFATMDYTPKEYTSSASLVGDFEKNLGEATAALSAVSDEELAKSWTMRNGETVYFELPRAAVLRSMVVNHIIHHRGQSSLYIRLLDIPVPEIYGPSADEGTM